MALATGQSRTDPPTGIAARIFTGLSGRLGFAGMNAAVLTVGSTARDAVSAILDGIAEGIFGTLVTDAAVTITIPQDAFGVGIPPAPVVVNGGTIA